ncbi:HEPACAM family member 2 [Bufo gargarizans]|uniref:HEPACAM family member 2 n=1 Tax=Bufo gargarizans TaxID=30331 RepID=UPI001CF24BEF|nr:HEPACAM family member 2 [Bufo gargarizans]
MERLSCPNSLLRCSICLILPLVFGTCSTLKLMAPSPIIHGIVGHPLTLPIHYDVNASASGVQIIWLLERPSAPPACLLTSFNHTFIPDLEFQHKFTMDPPNASLLINSLHMSDEGNYTVKVNIQGETTMSATQKIEVTVHVPVSEPIIDSEPSYGAVEYVGNLTFKCHAITGTRVRYQWLKDGSPLEKSATYSFSRDNSTFTIAPVMKNDIGNYSCLASNYISELESDSITPIIYYGPYGLRVISDKGLKVGEVFTIANGESVRFDCSADSNPPNTCAWIQRGNNSMEIINYGTHFKLLSEKVQQKTVDYLCRAYNNITGKGEETQFTVIITPIDPEKLSQITSSLFPLAAITGVSLFVIVSICFIFVWKKYQLHRAIQWKLQPRRPSTEYRRTPIYSGHEDAINDFGIYEFVSLPDSLAPHRVITSASNSLQVQDINGTIYEVIQFVPEQMQNDPQP